MRKLLFLANLLMNSLFPSVQEIILVLSSWEHTQIWPDTGKCLGVSVQEWGPDCSQLSMLDNQMNPVSYKLKPAGVFHCCQEGEELTLNLPELPIWETGLKRVAEE